MRQNLLQRKLSRAQTKYELKKKDVTQQSSYNLSLDVETKLRNENAIFEIGNSMYEVSNDYTIILEEGIIRIIGEEFNNQNNRLIFVHTEASDGTRKFQIKRKDNSSGNYRWFMHLYDKNIEGSIFSIYLDSESKQIIFDNKAPSIIDECVLELSENDLESNLCGYNKIFYGIPGCGKSYHIEHNVLKGVDKQYDVFRTTFYLDYSNSDFIGQIYPKTVYDEKGDKTKVVYENIPGPFTKALKRAFEAPDRMIYLVIEEINRGNAAAIFGDTFQLLDRLKVCYDGRVEGDSEYPISNQFIEDYLDDLVLPGQVYIPHNLTILATMNTSDQNVFPLDTAFKRRWDRERVVSNWDNCVVKDMYIPYTDITWKSFVDTMNSRMVEGNDKLETTVSEDKKIGAYFAGMDMLSSYENRHSNIEENKAKLKRFVNNVIDYLYNDVTKFDHSILFKDNISYDEIYKTMTEYQSDNSQEGLFENVLKEDILLDLISDYKDDE